MKRATVAFALLMILLTGCASADRQTATTPAHHAECLVCKKNADLACIDVAVDPATPTYVYAGTTYYFCSADCRDQFAKNPQKYLPKETR